MRLTFARRVVVAFVVSSVVTRIGTWFGLAADTPGRLVATAGWLLIAVICLCWAPVSDARAPVTDGSRAE